jgi:hypothetical protein
MTKPASPSASLLNRNDKGKRILLWLAFSVVFALGPVFINYLIARDDPAFEWMRWFGRGELFLISSALCADAVGRMWDQKRKQDTLASSA